MEPRCLFVILISIATLCNCGSNSSKVASYLDLIKHWEAERFAEFPPINNINLAIQINLDYIQSLDTSTQVLKINYFLMFDWYDTRLKWVEPMNGTAYNSLRKKKLFQVPASIVWVPKVYFLNEVSHKRPLNILTAGVEPVFGLDSDGHIFGSISGASETFCQANMDKFPYDQQECFIKIDAFSNGFLHLNVTRMKAAREENYYQPSNTWDLVSLASVELTAKKENARIWAVRLVVKRYATIYLMFIVIPMIVIACISNCQYIMPYNMDERIQYGLTCCLAMMLFLTIMSTMHPQSKEMGSLALYTIQCNTILAFNLLETILLNRFGRQNPVYEPHESAEADHEPQHPEKVQNNPTWSNKIKSAFIRFSPRNILRSGTELEQCRSICPRPYCIQQQLLMESIDSWFQVVMWFILGAMSLKLWISFQID